VTGDVLLQGQVRDWWVDFWVSVGDASVVVKATTTHTTKKLLALASSGDYESEGYLVPQVVA
jgi:hypothetical protein